MKPKYGNKKTMAGSIMFASELEANRWSELMLMSKAGIIKDLQLQPLYVLAPSVRFEGTSRTKPELRYSADFSYIEKGFRVVEDVKGVETQVFRIKRHLMKSVHGIDVRVIK